ncbi:MAG: helix-turn-helix domain-containing protein [Sandaracinaceae bacterium]
MRQAFPDGSVWVRTEPIGFLELDHETPAHAHDWHQLTFALSGHLEVETEQAKAIVPPDRAVWVPAGLMHRERMRAPVAVRTLYFAPGAIRDAPSMTRTLEVSPLLRELIAHVSPLGALDRSTARHAPLIDVLLDLLDGAPEVSLRLPTPRDPRARRLAERVHADPGGRERIPQLAARAGASRRTLERLFLKETGLSIGEWRRRARLLASFRRLEQGAAVADVAEEAGYASASAFGAAFTKFFGSSPRRARKR